MSRVSGETRKPSSQQGRWSVWASGNPLWLQTGGSCHSHLPKRQSSRTRSGGNWKVPGMCGPPGQQDSQGPAAGWGLGGRGGARISLCYRDPLHPLGSWTCRRLRSHSLEAGSPRAGCQQGRLVLRPLPSVCRLKSSPCVLPWLSVCVCLRLTPLL